MNDITFNPPPVTTFRVGNHALIDGERWMKKPAPIPNEQLNEICRLIQEQEGFHNVPVWCLFYMARKIEELHNIGEYNE